MERHLQLPVSQYVHFGEDYRQRIQASIDKAKADAAAQQVKAE